MNEPLKLLMCLSPGRSPYSAGAIFCSNETRHPEGELPANLSGISMVAEMGTIPALAPQGAPALLLMAAALAIRQIK